MFKLSKAKLFLAVLVLALVTGPFCANAQNVSQDSIKALQAQINALQKQLEDVKAAQTEAAAKAAKAAPSAPSKEAAVEQPERGTVKVGKAKITVGGFMEAAGIYRSKNEVADVGSNFNTAIPFDITGTGKGTPNPFAHQTEFRGSARQSRLTLLAEAKPNEDTKIAAYIEADFLGAAQTANSNESNSYNPRMRVIYGQVDMASCGLHFLAGQEWSLLTTNRVGITPRQENIPLTIDAQYVPGFNWTRNPQLRIVKDFDDQKIWAGLSVESPQAILSGITAPAFVNATNPGGSLFDKNNNYTSDQYPDIIAKLAFDPGYGHYEIFGVTRFFHDFVLTTGAPKGAAFGNNTATGFSGGAAAILPVIPECLDVQGNFMAGQGIGRYGSAQMPDMTFTPTGDIKLLNGYSAMVGAVGHPERTWDLYVYGGLEAVNRENFAVSAAAAPGIGYGDFSLFTGQEQSSDIWQITAGFWKRLYQGPYGKVQVGLQDSITQREAFSNSAGIAQHAYENIIMTSFRYYPL
jgi:hypothetical protein